MREKIKTFFCVFFLICALPYIITMCLQGKESQTKLISENIQNQKKTSEETPSEMEAFDTEEYLVGIVAKEMSVSYEIEALKAQAVIARTNLLAARKNGETLPETLSQRELLDMWGEEGFAADYQKLTEAVKATSGKVMTYQGEYIYAAYHAVSAGSTRDAAEALENEQMSWLAKTDSSMDIPSENYLKVIFLEKRELTERLTEAFEGVVLDEANPMEYLQIISRDSSEYVTKIQVGEKTVTGEEFRLALELSSACFYIKEVEGKIRIVTKGLGHGLGMSQYGANVLAADGSNYQEILNYYFKNIEISD